MADLPGYRLEDVVKAIEDLDSSTTRLATVNVILTGVILALTVAQVLSLFAR